MKNLTLIFALSALISCSGKEEAASSNILENLTFSVDTLMVDTGDAIIDLSFEGRFASVSLDAQKYFYYDYRKTAIEEVDLQSLKLTNTYQFTKEGPNAIGFNPPTIQPMSNDRFFVVSSGINVGTYFKNGDKEKNLKFNFKEIAGLDIDEGGYITKEAQISPDEKFLFAKSDPYKTSSDVRLIIVDLESKTGRSISLPHMVPTLNFKVVLRQEKLVMGIQEGINLKTLNNRLFITSTATSDTYVYDYLTDSLSLFEFPHQLVPPKKTAEIKSLVADEKEFHSESAKFKYQVSFNEFLWDEQRGQYFRFGYKLIPRETPKLEKKTEVFLFAYDENLSLIGEARLENIEYRFESPFFKDGELWSFVNVEDELGFAVMDFNF